MESVTKLKQEIHYLQQKLEYQQNLLQDERRVTDNLIANKNKAIEGFQLKLEDLQKSFEAACAECKAEKENVFLNIIMELIFEGLSVDAT